MWILGSALLDFVFIYGIGLAGLLLSFLLFANTNPLPITLIYLFAFAASVDAGHVYLTLWRTFFNSQEFLRKKLFYLLTPVFFFSVFLLWQTLHLPYLWNAVLYGTFYHHYKQFYGVQKWYQKINGDTEKVSDIFFKILFILPFIAFHFGPQLSGVYYTNTDIFYYYWPELKHTLLFVNLLVIFLWIAYELKKYKKTNVVHWGRIFSIAVPTLLSTTVSWWAQHTYQILIPLVSFHGVTYAALVGLAMSRTNYSSWGKVKCLGIAMGSLAFFGILVFWLENNVVSFTEPSQTFSLPLATQFLTSIYVACLFSHYIFDGMLWKGVHPEAKQIYSS